MNVNLRAAAHRAVAHRLVPTHQRKRVLATQAVVAAHAVTWPSELEVATVELGASLFVNESVVVLLSIRICKNLASACCFSLGRTELIRLASIDVSIRILHVPIYELRSLLPLGLHLLHLGQ